MRIAFLTGIWPPDVGGPATHGPDFARFLVARGHEVHVVTMGDGEPSERPCEVEVVSRRLPFPLRYGRVALAGARAARRADVVYASATYAAAAIASTLGRRPLVAKLVSDPAYERAQRYGLFSGTIEEFQRAGSRPVRMLKALRNTALRRASTVVAPSAYLAAIAGAWGLRADHIHVLTNPAPPPRDVEPEELPRGTFVFVGRLTRAKDLGTAIAAIGLVSGARLVVVGDGPDRAELERLAVGSAAAGRIEFRGALPRDDALRVVAGAEAGLLSSAWENLPHSAVEALSVGVPVVATSVGGVPEVVHHGENGLLVPPGRPDELAAALRRLLEEPGLRERLAAGARPSVEAISSEAIYGRLEELLAEAAPVRGGPVSGLPRVLFVGRGRYSLPLPGWLAKKWDAIEPQIDYRVLGAADEGSGSSNDRFRLARPLRPRRLDGALFHLLLPFRVRRELRELRPAAVIASDPFCGAAALAGRGLAGMRTPVIVEVHGDWRTFTRLYGSPARRLLAPFADRVAAYGVRHADATRAVSTFTARLVEDARGRPPDAIFTAFSDLSAFNEGPPAPLPARPTILFVAALERYKNVDGLAAAWRLVAGQVPDARLVIVGRGSRRLVVEQLVAAFPDRVVHHDWLEPHEVAAALDDATALVLPSWPEGMGRVVIEAFARGRAVVATDAGGIPDLVTEGVEGLLVPPADVPALAAALERVLADRELAERLGTAARQRYADWHWTPEQLATAMRELVDSVAG